MYGLRTLYLPAEFNVTLDNRTYIGGLKNANVENITRVNWHLAFASHRSRPRPSTTHSIARIAIIRKYRPLGAKADSVHIVGVDETKGSERFISIRIIGYE